MPEIKDVLAVDIGTSSVRAAVINLHGQILCKAQRTYDIIISDKYSQEQDPRILTQEVFTTIKTLMQDYDKSKSTLGAICFSSQMYNIFPVDANDKPLYNMLLWSDSRSEAQADNFKVTKGKRFLYDETGCPVDSIFPISKLLWLKENQGNIYSQAKKFISIKEYLLWQMTGQYIVDYSMASATGLFDIQALRWSERALNTIGITPERLSMPVSGLKKFELSNDALRKNLGLPDGIVVVSGGGDGPLANIGSGASLEGYMNIDLGTSGAARVTTNKPILDTAERLWSFSVAENMWVYGGILSTVGNGYRWLVENFRTPHAGDEAAVYREIAERIGQVPPEPDSVIFIPYLLKERSPNWDTRAKAVIYNLTVADDFFKVARAYVESIAFSLMSLLEIVEQQIQVSKIILTGGLAQSEQIAQLIADVLGRDIVVRESSEGSLMGAAIFGLKAIGEIDGYSFTSSNDKAERVIEHNAVFHRIYSKKYQRFSTLNQALRNINL